jgi:ubiquinone/menaquinone biosynthesis C-methylase UbiE
MSAQDKNAEQAYYDDLFSRRKRFDQFQNAIYERLATEARSRTDGTMALDIGCGAGNQSLCLMQEGFSVISADLSMEAVKVTRDYLGEAGKQAWVVNTDAESLPLPDNSVDVCICGLLLHHFRTLDKVAAEIRRVVRPGGVVVAIDANAHNPFAWLFFNVVHRFKPLPHLTPNQRALWAGEIRRSFGPLGFEGFEFDSMTSDLKKGWLGDSLGARLNFYTRRAVLAASNAVLPKISTGNMLISVFRLSADS